MVGKKSYILYSFKRNVQNNQFNLKRMALRYKYVRLIMEHNEYILS